MAHRSLDRVEEPAADRNVLLLVTPEGGTSYNEVKDRLERRGVHRCIVTGPSARAALAEAQSAAPTHIVAVPFSFGTGAPWPADLSGLVRWARTRWPEITFLQSRQVGWREHVVGWASQQTLTSLNGRSAGASAGDVAVLVVGEGTAPSANAEVCALGRLLGEHQDCAIEVAFARDTRPTVAMGIERCRRPGVQRIIVVPLALLDGPFHEEVHAQTRAISANGLPETITIAAPLLTPATAAAVVHRRYTDALARWLDSGDDGCTLEHRHGSVDLGSYAYDDVFPPRYRSGRVVSAASMRSAPLEYDEEGRVAWDRVWQTFCDLALAGGPPHRGTLLEPPSREEVLASPTESARVVAEIARGVALITRLPVVTTAAPGWVGLVCRDEEMAVWLLRAIVVENISVRREGATLLLPAGPAYRLEKEIKNVITVVAKTHHYWTEHRRAG